MALMQFAIKGNVQEMMKNFTVVREGAKKAQKSMAKDVEETSKLFEAQTGTMMAAGAATVGMLWGMAKVSPLVGSLLTQFGDAIGFIVTMLVMDFLPAFENVLDAMYLFGGWMETAPTWLKAVLVALMALPAAYTAITVGMQTYAVIMGTVSALQYAYGTSTFATTAATWGFTAALLANPMTWIVVAVIALIAALYLLWK
ncbi:unnamed protein product, partial [marine sediment metagenome]